MTAPHNTFLRQYFSLQALNGRLPFEQGSDMGETLPKRVSNDSRRFIFRRPKKIFWRNFRIEKSVFCDFGQDFEELQANGPQNQLRRQILLQIQLS